MMLHLPKGKLVRPPVNPARINLPQAMEKLRRGRFSGYLRFDDAQGSGIVLFQDGRLINSIFTDAEQSELLIAYDALTRIFEASIKGNAQLSIYHVSGDLALQLHALFKGKVRRAGVDVRQLDVAVLQQQIANESLSVCLRIYASDRTALIFYDKGCALGFFIDGKSELLQQVEVSGSVAAQADAHLDMIVLDYAVQQPMTDLMTAGDLQPVWQRTRDQVLGKLDLMS